MCHKVCLSKREAEEALSRIKTRYRRKHRREKRAYFCEKHNAWHLTSQEEFVENLDIPLQFLNVWQNLYNKNTII